jgi:putative ABC transport system ATP-binding protein
MAANRFEMPVRYESLGCPIIRMRAITKIFKTAAGETTVLKDINIEVPQGQFMAIVGRSGSGKSTLVNMITGIDHPSSGTVEVGNLPIHQMPESAMAVWRGKHLGIVFQFFQLLPMLTLIENVMLPMDFCNIYSPASREERAFGLLRQVGLEGLAHKLPGAVAGGQQQSAAVARALANDPPILIADEPTGNLDSNTAEQVMCIFEELIDQGKTILLVTHDHSLAQRTNRILLISDGELVNELVAAAFPGAPHPQLLSLSKQAISMHLPPGAPLQSPSAQPSPVYLLACGELVSGGDGKTILQTIGSLIDPMAMQRRLRAGEQGADLLALPRDDVVPLLAASPLPPLSTSDLHKQSLPKSRWFRRLWRPK